VKFSEQSESHDLGALARDQIDASVEYSLNKEVAFVLRKADRPTVPLPLVVRDLEASNACERESSDYSRQ
jgi:hypothetical protein